MPIHERRQHFRIDDHIYFDYRILKENETLSEHCLEKRLLEDSGLRYIEASQYFQDIDRELAELTQKLGIKEPALAHYLNLLNAKIDFLSRHLLMGHNSSMRKVNISLGGMAFKTAEKLSDKTLMKILIFTKPKMVPIIVTGNVVYSKYHDENHYRTAVEFSDLSHEQEQLLSLHIMQAQSIIRSN